MVKVTVVRLLALIPVLLPCMTAHAVDPLDLDTGFGLAGRVATNFGDTDAATSIAFQTDGKIVVAGYSFVGRSWDFSVARYHPGGSLDLSFGINGRATTDLGAQDMAFGVAVQGDGKIVVAGGSDSGPQGSSIALVRYEANGTLDSGFGNGGIVITDIKAFDYAFGLALQANGRILVVGQTHASNGLDDSDLVVVRYLMDGSLDGSFGTGGIVVTDFSDRWDIGKNVAVLNDGRIVVAGSSWGDGFSPVYGVLARYHPNGFLDQSLNQGWPAMCPILGGCGKVSLNLGGGSYDWISALAVRRPDGIEDGKMIVSGAFGVARVNPDGTLDTSFSGDGINETATNAGDGVAIRNDGRVVRAGRNVVDFGVELYDFDGDLASDCSATPAATVDFNGGEDSAYAVALQADGKIVVAGGGEVFDLGDYALARFLGGDCNPALALGKKRYFVAYHKFVHKQDTVGPNWPGAVPEGLVRSTQVVVPAVETAQAGPYAYKSYAFGDAGVAGSGVTAQAFGEVRAFVSEGEHLLLATAIGDFEVVIGRRDYAMLPASVQAPRVCLDVARTDATAGYQCHLAKSPTAGRLVLADPLAPARRISSSRVTHVCETWDGTERTAAVPDVLLCFAAQGDRDRRHRVFVRDSFGPQLAELGSPESVCVEAIVGEQRR